MEFFKALRVQANRDEAKRQAAFANISSEKIEASRAVFKAKASEIANNKEQLRKELSANRDELAKISDNKVQNLIANKGKLSKEEVEATLSEIAAIDLQVFELEHKISFI